MAKKRFITGIPPDVLRDLAGLQNREIAAVVKWLNDAVILSERAEMDGKNVAGEAGVYNGTKMYHALLDLPDLDCSTFKNGPTMAGIIEKLKNRLLFDLGKRWKAQADGAQGGRPTKDEPPEYTRQPYKYGAKATIKGPLRYTLEDVDLWTLEECDRAYTEKEGQHKLYKMKHPSITMRLREFAIREKSPSPHYTPDAWAKVEEMVLFRGKKKN